MPGVMPGVVHMAQLVSTLAQFTLHSLSQPYTQRAPRWSSHPLLAEDNVLSLRHS
jgi:hypothetical protein